MSVIDDPDLYEKAKKIVYKQYPKHSAYRSGQLVKTYKDLGGTYSGKKPTSGLTSWFKEEWKDIGNKDYPVYRPTKRVNKNTPLLPSEIDPKNLKKQIELKQELKGDKNLPPFSRKGGAGQSVSDIAKSNPIWKVSNPILAQSKLNKYIGKNTPLLLSTRKDKKYMVLDPEGKKIHFGNINYEDFTKHGDLTRRNSYISRASNIKGDWKRNKYSPNNLAINVLW